MPEGIGELRGLCGVLKQLCFEEAGEPDHETNALEIWPGLGEL